jgi:putative ABC transport system permease protein
VSLLRVWRTLRRRRGDDPVLREEIAAHLAALEETFRSQGLSREEARTAARRQFGNRARVEEDVRAEFGFGALERFALDLRYAARGLRRSPTFTAFSLLVLALGIGITTIIFSVVESVLVRPLPFREPDRLMMLEEKWLPRFPRFEASPLDFVSWQQHTTSFSGLAAFRDGSYNLTGTDRPERLRGQRITANLPSLLGVEPILGRTFTREEDTDGGPWAALLGYGLWLRRFGADPKVIGTTITLNGVTRTVVGVMPPGFQFPRDVEIWSPMRFSADDLQSRGNHILWAIGRLRPGVTRQQAQAEMDALMPRLQKVWTARVVPITDYYVGEIRLALVLLLGAAGFVLLIACVNLAGLVSARRAAVRQAVALRAALGASRARLVQQLLAENVLLSAGGGALGVLLAYVGIAAVSRLPLPGVPRLEAASLDIPVLAFAAGLSALTTVLVGLAPTLRMTRADLQGSLRTRGRESSPRRSGTPRALVACEVALTVMLLAGAGLFLGSLSRLLAVRPGIRADGVLTVGITLPAVAYRPGSPIRFGNELVERLRSRPGITEVGISTSLPFSTVQDSGIRFDGRADGELAGTTANHYRITPGYLRALEIPIVRGRAFGEEDSETSAPVVLINKTMARRYFPGEDPIGRRLDIAGPTYMREIVGVVGDVKQEGLRVPTAPQVYEPFAQKPSGMFTLVVRGVGDPRTLSEAVREEVLAIDRQLPIADVRPMEDIIAATLTRDRLSAWLLSLFATLALVVACAGVYGVIASSIADRTREIGIRMALGADPRRVLRLLVGESVRPALVGIGCGLAAFLALARAFENLVFDVTPRDPATLAVASIVVLGATVAAALIPAARARRIDPVTALRLE